MKKRIAKKQLRVQTQVRVCEAWWHAACLDEHQLKSGTANSPYDCCLGNASCEQCMQSVRNNLPNGATYADFKKVVLQSGCLP